jgi:hypothetical protein
MAKVIRCPRCGLPFLPEEVAAENCPTCGGSLGGVGCPVPGSLTSIAPAALPVGLSRRRSWALLAAVAIPVLLAALAIHFGGQQETSSSSPDRPTRTQVPVAPAADPANEMSPAPQPSTPTMQPADRATPILAKQTQTVTQSPAESARTEPPAQERKPEQIDPEKHGEEIRLNDPDGAYSVAELLDGATLKLTGQIRTLTVNRVDGEALLDASGLRAREIIFAGPVNGGSWVRVFAPGGKVELRDQINGLATAEIEAPGGKVVLGAPTQTCINGTTLLSITAAEVDLRGKAGGAARIHVTLSRGGKLKFGELDGAARLEYRRSAPDDPAPTVERGRVFATAKVVETPAQ